VSLFARLSRYSPAAWLRAVDALADEIHPIDLNATRIWFAFYPLELHLALETAADSSALARTLGLMGRWRLADQVETSHRFFYAHRYWPQIKAAVQAYSGGAPEDLAALATVVAGAAARTARVDRENLLGLTLAALMTLRQAGPDAFGAERGAVHLPPATRALSPHQVLKRRARDDSQGIFGFARGLKKRWTVTFDENDPAARFTAIHGQEIASAAHDGVRDYRSRDPRCTPGEGPIPVECRAASCGTCWIGVLGGAAKLSPVVERDEGRRLRVFGYAETGAGEPTPLIRLACQARALGAVSIVIPPWNGIIGAIRPALPARE
jgi:ferredoxin